MLFRLGQEMLEIIKKMVEKPCPEILDIGAKDKAVADHLMKLSDSPSVFAFQPEPRAVSGFKDRVKEHNSETFIEVAVEGEPVFMIFCRSSGFEVNAPHDRPARWNYSGAIRSPKEHLTGRQWVQFYKRVVVAMVDLNNWVRKYNIDCDAHV